MEKILKILEENARISLEDIATMVESTPEEVAKQIDAYQQAHVINGYKALIDWDKAADNPSFAAAMHTFERAAPACAVTESPLHSMFPSTSPMWMTTPSNPSSANRMFVPLPNK